MLAVCVTLVAQAATLADPVDRSALMSPLADRTVMLGLTSTGSRFVAVGERGVVLLSDDQGQSWRQAQVPVSVSLTAIAFADTQIGWAVGHGGIVLKTEDGGEHWKLQIDGRKIAQQMADSGRFSENEAMRWRREGADKPFLALQVNNAKSIQIVGAYGLAFRSGDGGDTWEFFGDKLNNPKANHLYAIEAQGKDIFIAGEQGCFFVSDDAGVSFRRLELPYKGSLFELHKTPKGLYAVGMKGKLLFTSDLGKTWKDVPNPIPVMLLSVVDLPGGKQLWLNQAGQFMLGGEDAQALLPVPNLVAAGANRILLGSDERLVIAGFHGVAAMPLKQ